MAILPIFANASVEINGIYYNLISESHSAEVTSGTNNYSGSIVIPQSVTYNDIEYSVTSIGSSAFSGCSGLTNITISNSVTNIGRYAFLRCSSLISINIPNSVTSIEGSAFEKCSGLTSVTVESGNIKYDSRNNCNAIIETSTNTLVVGCMNTIIPNSVTSIGKLAFSNNSGLTSITIPNSVTSIGEFAFYGCNGLTSITIPSSVISIGHYAFENCSGLTSITIPNFVTSIGVSAFEGCSDLRVVNYNATNCTSMGSYYSHVFTGCSSLTTLNIGDNVQIIPDYAFYDSNSLTSVTIGNSVTSIGSLAFGGCSGLTSVNIPNSVTSIGISAFYGCSGLTSVDIPNSVTSIGGNAFYGCSSLTSITIPNSVTSISGSTFSGCSSLTSVTIPNSVTSIGGWVFYGCSSLTSITIPNSVTSIGEKAFSGCDNITSVISEITEPFNCGSDAFPENACRNGTLYVPAGTKDLYIRFDGWRNFLHIEEMDGEAAKYHLSFVVNNKELSTKEVEAGATITPPTTDSEGNTVSWYTYPATMPAHDLVVYGMVVKQPEPEVLVWLTVKDGQGTTKMKVRKGTEQVLTITPEEGWKVVSVTLDGVDVTAQVKDGSNYTTPAITSDATLTVVYEQEAPSDVAATRAAQATVTVVDDGVVIADAEPQSRCVVYTSNGQPVVSTVIEGDSQKIRLPKGQVYILTINGRTLKFAL